MMEMAIDIGLGIVGYSTLVALLVLILLRAKRAPQPVKTVGQRRRELDVGWLEDINWDWKRKDS